MNLKGAIEGLLFVVGDDGLTIDTITDILEIDEKTAKELLTELRKDYESDSRGIRISFLGNAFKLTTKKEHKELYNKLVTTTSSHILSNAALEVLAIVAYNEPITRIKIEEIRGVNSDQIVRKLVARNFLKEAGKSDSIGRPTLYKTTNEFLDYFGLATKEDLPEIDMSKYEGVDEEKDLYATKYTEEGDN